MAILVDRLERMRWQPAHEAHAIERVSLTFQFDEPIHSKPWQSLLAAASLDLPKQGFNAISDHHELPLAQIVSPAGSRGPAPGFAIPGQPIQLAVTGRSFQVVNGGQVREEVLLLRNQFTHATLLYNGWASHRSRVLALLGGYIERALTLVNLQLVKLEYWDRFLFDGDPEDVDYGSLLRRGSRHLPGFPFGMDQLWHSHVGYFVNSGASQRLVNVNVDAFDVAESPAPDQPPVRRRTVGIHTMAQDTMGPDPSLTVQNGVGSTLEALHTTLKETFADVITPEASERISLNARVPS